MQAPALCPLLGWRWIHGHLIDGTQAEYVRIPHGDNSLYPLPEGANEEALVMLSDIMPTGLEIGRAKPGVRSRSPVPGR